MTEQKYHRYNEAGRRLKAALVSYQFGRAGVDSTLKQTPEFAGEGWAEIAERLLLLLNGIPPNNIFEFPKSIR